MHSPYKIITCRLAATSSLSSSPLIKELLFLGCGSSSSVPHIECLTTSPPTCSVCIDAYSSPTSPNRRRNTCAVVRYEDTLGTIRSILIDCGKTFYESALSYLVPLGIRTLDAALLTHPHADAVFGLDDLRSWNAVQNSLDIFLSQRTLPTIARTFPYLVDTRQATGGGAVSKLNFKTFNDNCEVLRIGELEVNPIRVIHGDEPDGSPFYCTAFRFGDVLYLSDVSKVPDESMYLLNGAQVMIVDALKDEGYYKSHFSLDQALQLIFSVKPKYAFLVGMGHQMEYHRVNNNLAQYKSSHGIEIQLAVDGMRIFFEYNQDNSAENNNEL